MFTTIIIEAFHKVLSWDSWIHNSHFLSDEVSNWFLLERLTGPLPVKFLAFYGTWRLSTVFTRARHPSRCEPDQSSPRRRHQSHFFMIHFSTILPSICRTRRKTEYWILLQLICVCKFSCNSTVFSLTTRFCCISSPLTSCNEIRYGKLLLHKFYHELVLFAEICLKLIISWGRKCIFFTFFEY
jgi:hypothetical protein